MGLNLDAPPQELSAITVLESSLILPHFTADDAWKLGTHIRERLLPVPTPAVVNIALANSSQLLFHCVTHPGAVPDNDRWVERKRRTVLRWGVSSWYMHVEMGGDENAFAKNYMLGESAGEYAIHGGGVPVRVRGCEGVAAVVVVVSGLRQEDDYMVVVEGLQELKAGMAASKERD